MKITRSQLEKIILEAGRSSGTTSKQVEKRFSEAIFDMLDYVAKDEPLDATAKAKVADKIRKRFEFFLETGLRNI
jgi:hypothetical protein